MEGNDNKQRAIPEAYNYLDQRITSLISMLEELEKRLVKLLIPPPPSTEKEKKDVIDERRLSFAEDLKILAYRVQIVNERLASILDRLEI